MPGHLVFVIDWLRCLHSPSNSATWLLTKYSVVTVGMRAKHVTHLGTPRLQGTAERKPGSTWELLLLPGVEAVAGLPYQSGEAAPEAGNSL